MHSIANPTRIRAFIWLLPLTLLVLVLTPLLTAIPAQAQDVTPVPGDEVAEDVVGATEEVAEETINFLDRLLDQITSLTLTPVAVVLLVIGGVLLLFAGWRIYEYIIIVAGFLIGASIGLALVMTENTLVSVAALLIGGLLGAALSVFVYYLAVFVIGAYVGIVLTNNLAVLLSLTPVTSIALLIGGLIGGLVLLGLSFQFLILLAAIVGAQMITLALGLNPVWTVILAIIGVIAQLGLVRAFEFDYRSRRRWTLFNRT